MELTWGEFKRRVEENGVQDSTVLAWIDWAGPAPSVSVKVRDDGMVEITQAFEGELEDAVNL